MAWLYGVCLLALLRLPALEGSNMSQAPAYRLRKALFSTYDKMVLPVLQPSDVINVTFEVDFKQLTEVDDKAQVITTETVITQIWNNPFLRWDPADYGEIQHILLAPNEIWVPDIVLQNNADVLVIQAGHLEKFRTYVVVRFDGQNAWVNPATFQSSCNLDVQFFPFDKQKCRMVFRSLTADLSLMDLNTKVIESDHPQEELKVTSSNGYWSLRSIAIKTNKYKSQREFREVVVSFFIGRRPLFFVLFSFVPCMLIGMLILVSFFIPAESGERIGLCATILVSVSVYLLVVTDQLPEQSQTLPLIGVYYIVVIFQIGLALSATVLVLMAHHATSEPPRFLTCLTVLNRSACLRKGRRRRETITRPVKQISGEENAAATTQENKSKNDVELGEIKMRTERPSTAISVVTVNEDSLDEETWKEIARALDRIFFWLFLALFVVSSIVVYGQAGRLSTIDKF